MLHVIHWAPSDVLVSLGPIQIRYYGLCFVLAFLFGLKIIRPWLQRDGIGKEKLDTLVMYVFAGTIIGARLGHILFYEGLSYLIAHPVESIFPFSFDPEFHFTGYSGLASHGGAIAIFIALYIYSKRVIGKPFVYILDRFSVVATLGAALIRIGNLMNSEIIGKPTDVAWGFVFEKAHVIDPMIPRHPAQLYESVGYFLLFLFLLRRAKHRKFSPPGDIFGWFLVGLFGIRFLVEFFKNSQGGFEESWGFLSTGQWLSIPFVLAGAVLLWKSMQTKPVN